MRNLHTCIFCLVLLVSQTAAAQLFRAYLSTDGSDSNACTLPAPCRLLPAALAAVSSGGEIWILDSGNFNSSTVNVTKSVTILAVPGVVGSLVANGGAAVTIATADLEVTFDNLNMVPFVSSPGQVGIDVSASTQLTLLRCKIFGFNTSALRVTQGGNFAISDSTFNNNGTAIAVTGARLSVVGSTLSHNGVGITVTGSASATVASIARSSLTNNTSAITLGSSTEGTHAQVSVSDSQLSNNTSHGLFGTTGSATTSTAKAVITNTQISANQTGVQIRGVGGHASIKGSSLTLNTGNAITADLSATALLSGNLVTGNSRAVNNSSSTVETTGDNIMRANANLNIGAVTSVSGS